MLYDNNTQQTSVVCYMPQQPTEACQLMAQIMSAKALNSEDNDKSAQNNVWTYTKFKYNFSCEDYLDITKELRRRRSLVRVQISSYTKWILK